MTILAKIALTAALMLVASLVLVGVGCCAYDYYEGSTLYENYKRIQRCGTRGVVASVAVLLGCLLTFIWTR